MTDVDMETDNAPPALPAAPVNPVSAEIWSTLGVLAATITAFNTRFQSQFEWVDGALVQSLRAEEMLLIDEISLADDAVLERLNTLPKAILLEGPPRVAEICLVAPIGSAPVVAPAASSTKVSVSNAASVLPATCVSPHTHLVSIVNSLGIPGLAVPQFMVSIHALLSRFAGGAHTSYANASASSLKSLGVRNLKHWTLLCAQQIQAGGVASRADDAGADDSGHGLFASLWLTFQHSYNLALSPHRGVDTFSDHLTQLFHPEYRKLVLGQSAAEADAAKTASLLLTPTLWPTSSHALISCAPTSTSRALEVQGSVLKYLALLALGQSVSPRDEHLLRAFRDEAAANAGNTHRLAFLLTAVWKFVFELVQQVPAAEQSVAIKTDEPLVVVPAGDATPAVTVSVLDQRFLVGASSLIPAFTLSAHPPHAHPTSLQLFHLTCVAFLEHSNVHDYAERLSWMQRKLLCGLLFEEATAGTPTTNVGAASQIEGAARSAEPHRRLRSPAGVRVSQSVSRCIESCGFDSRVIQSDLNPYLDPSFLELLRTNADKAAHRQLDQMLVQWQTVQLILQSTYHSLRETQVYAGVPVLLSNPSQLSLLELSYACYTYLLQSQRVSSMVSGISSDLILQIYPFWSSMQGSEKNHLEHSFNLARQPGVSDETVRAFQSALARLVHDKNYYWLTIYSTKKLLGGGSSADASSGPSGNGVDSMLSQIHIRWKVLSKRVKEVVDLIPTLAAALSAKARQLSAAASSSSASAAGLSASYVHFHSFFTRLQSTLQGTTHSSTALVGVKNTLWKKGGHPLLPREKALEVIEMQLQAIERQIQYRPAYATASMEAAGGDQSTVNRGTQPFFIVDHNFKQILLNEQSIAARGRHATLRHDVRRWTSDRCGLRVKQRLSRQQRDSPSHSAIASPLPVCRHSLPLDLTHYGTIEPNPGEDRPCDSCHQWYDPLATGAKPRAATAGFDERKFCSKLCSDASVRQLPTGIDTVAAPSLGEDPTTNGSLLSSSPAVAWASSRCLNCSSDGAAGLRCSRCKQVYYCTLECQKADWKKHMIVCKLLAVSKVIQAWLAGPSSLTDHILAFADDVVSDAIRFITSAGLGEPGDRVEIRLLRLRLALIKIRDSWSDVATELNAISLQPLAASSPKEYRPHSLSSSSWKAAFSHIASTLHVALDQLANKVQYVFTKLQLAHAGPILARDPATNNFRDARHACQEILHHLQLWHNDFKQFDSLAAVRFAHSHGGRSSGKTLRLPNEELIALLKRGVALPADKAPKVAESSPDKADKAGLPPTTIPVQMPTKPWSPGQMRPCGHSFVRTLQMSAFNYVNPRSSEHPSILLVDIGTIQREFDELLMQLLDVYLSSLSSKLKGNMATVHLAQKPDGTIVQLYIAVSGFNQLDSASLQKVYNAVAKKHPQLAQLNLVTLVPFNLDGRQNTQARQRNDALANALDAFENGRHQGISPETTRSVHLRLLTTLIQIHAAPEKRGNQKDIYERATTALNLQPDHFLILELIPYLLSHPPVKAAWLEYSKQPRCRSARCESITDWLCSDAAEWSYQVSKDPNPDSMSDDARFLESTVNGATVSDQFFLPLWRNFESHLSSLSSDVRQIAITLTRCAESNLFDYWLSHPEIFADRSLYHAVFSLWTSNKDGRDLVENDKLVGFALTPLCCLCDSNIRPALRKFTGDTTAVVSTKFGSHQELTTTWDCVRQTLTIHHPAGQQPNAQLTSILIAESHRSTPVNQTKVIYRARPPIGTPESKSDCGSPVASATRQARRPSGGLAASLVLLSGEWMSLRRAAARRTPRQIRWLSRWPSGGLAASLGFSASGAGAGRGWEANDSANPWSSPVTHSHSQSHVHYAPSPSPSPSSAASQPRSYFDGFLAATTLAAQLHQLPAGMRASPAAHAHSHDFSASAASSYGLSHSSSVGSPPSSQMRGHRPHSASCMPAPLSSPMVRFDSPATTFKPVPPSTPAHLHTHSAFGGTIEQADADELGFLLHASSDFDPPPPRSHPHAHALFATGHARASSATVAQHARAPSTVHAPSSSSPHQPRLGSDSAL